MSEVLRLRDVSFVRNGNQILKNVNFSVNEGEHWAILGPNGSGKTTLAGIIAGRLFPSSGTAEILDEKLGNVALAELHSRIGFASSEVVKRLAADATAYDVVLSNAYGTVALTQQPLEAGDFERAQDLLNIFGVGQLRDRAIGTLSDGEVQRVLLARALMGDPELLLLDEPAAGLDMGAREELLGALTELAEAPASPVLMLITHHVEEIPAKFTHAALLKAGELVHAGAIENVLTAENLSETFGLPLQLQRHNGRWSAQGRS